MKYPEYQEKMQIGLVFGDGVRSYTLETVTPDLTVLRGTSRARRQESSFGQGSKRAIPTEVILDIVTAIETGRIGLEDIMRTSLASKGVPPLFEHLNLDHDPFILGYDSTIKKVCDFLISGRMGNPGLFSAADETVPVGSPLPKPFLLLAGISGTGKTRWVRDREVAGKQNVSVIPVRPDWHEPSDLLGYVSRIVDPPVYVLPTRFLGFLIRAWRDAWLAEETLNPLAPSLSAMTPFWLCLDEMNLAPVEQYFADYLSVLEGRRWSLDGYDCPPLLKFGDEAELVLDALGLKNGDALRTAFLKAREPGIPLPPNLVVVGTVNMDETTHAFSRKVLDRALTIEFDAVDFSTFGGTPLEPWEKTDLPWTGLSGYTDANDAELASTTKTAVLKFLEHWNQTMAQGPFRIAYRTINESLLIAASLANKPIGEVLDWVAMTKLLPRLEGDEEKLQALGEGTVLDKLLADWPAQFDASWDHSRTQRKLAFMTRRLGQSSYTSFWP